MALAVTDNLRKLWTCPDCGMIAMFEDPNEVGHTKICMECGASRHYDDDGQPYVPPPDIEYERVFQRYFVRGLRCTVLKVRLVPKQGKRGMVEWMLRPPDEYDVAVYYHPANNGKGKWRIHSAEVRPALPDDLMGSDLSTLKKLLREAIATLVEPPAELSKAMSWELEPWGAMLRFL